MEAIGAARVHEPIGAGAAFNRQFRLLWTSRRPLLLIVGLVGLLALAGPPFLDINVAAPRLTLIWGFTVLVGAIWAFSVFTNEGPSQRYYHWSQPTGRATHSLARVAAGIAWLVIAGALLAIAGFVFAAMDGNAAQLAALPAGAWANFLTGPLLGYLAVSILTVATDYPIRWFFGVVFLVPMVAALFLANMGQYGLLEALARPLTHDTWGLANTMGGAFAQAASEIAVEGFGGRAEPVQIPISWWLATLAWGTLFAVLVAASAAVHPDRLRLRWSR